MAIDAAARAAKRAAREKDERALIYANLLNGAPLCLIMEHYHKSEEDVMAVFRYVTAKIQSFLLKACRVPIPCSCLTEAQRFRVQLLSVLTEVNLDVEPEFKRVVSERVNPGNVQEAFNDLSRKRL